MVGSKDFLIYCALFHLKATNGSVSVCNCTYWGYSFVFDHHPQSEIVPQNVNVWTKQPVVSLSWWLREFRPVCPLVLSSSHTPFIPSLPHSLIRSSSSQMFFLTASWEQRETFTLLSAAWWSFFFSSVIRSGWLEGLPTFQEMGPNHQDVILVTSNAVQWVCLKREASVVIFFIFFSNGWGKWMLNGESLESFQWCLCFLVISTLWVEALHAV